MNNNEEIIHSGGTDSNDEFTVVSEVVDDRGTDCYEFAVYQSNGWVRRSRVDKKYIRYNNQKLVGNSIYIGLPM